MVKELLDGVEVRAQYRTMNPVFHVGASSHTEVSELSLHGAGRHKKQPVCFKPFNTIYIHNSLVKIIFMGKKENQGQI